MEMDHDAGVSSNTLHRVGVIVGCRISTLKEVVHASPRGDLSSVHHVLYMTQGRVLRRGQAGNVGIVWLRDWSSDAFSVTAYLVRSAVCGGPRRFPALTVGRRPVDTADSALAGRHLPAAREHPTCFGSSSVRCTFFQPGFSGVTGGF
jgi:hypothetical protein